MDNQNKQMIQHERIIDQFLVNHASDASYEWWMHITACTSRANRTSTVVIGIQVMLHHETQSASGGRCPTQTVSEDQCLPWRLSTVN